VETLTGLHHEDRLPSIKSFKVHVSGKQWEITIIKLHEAEARALTVKLFTMVIYTFM